MTTAIDLMYERESERMWEEQNAPAYDGETLRQAARSMSWAVKELDKACDSVNEAAELLTDTPFGDKLLSYLDEMEKILCDQKAMQKEFERGAC